MATAAGYSGKIREARGRTVSQIDPVMLLVLHRFDLIEADALTEIVETLEPGSARLRRHLLWIVPAAIAGFAAFLLVLYLVSDDSGRQDLVGTITNPVIMGPTLLWCVAIPFFTARAARLRRAGLAMLRHRRCPHCGYDIRGLPADPHDEAIVCPECGCAWIINDDDLDAGLAAAIPAGGAARHRAVAIAVLVLMLFTAVIGGYFAFRFG